MLSRLRHQNLWLEFPADESRLKKMMFLEACPFALPQEKFGLHFELLEKFPVDESWGRLK